MIFSSWKKSILAIVTPAVFLGGAVGAVLLPKVFHERSALKEARERDFEHTLEARSIEELRTALKQVKDKDPGQFFISAERPLEFIESMESIAQRSSGKIDITLLPESKEKNEQGWEVRLTGSFKAALAFLGALEAQAKLLRVDEVTSQLGPQRPDERASVITTIHFYAPRLP